jgi:ABC-type transport system substrate-binding protein
VATSDGLQVTNLPFLQQAKAQGLVDYHAQASTVWEHFDMNQWPWDDRLPWFAKTEVRQAVGFGTNRQQMTEEILYGEVEPMRSWIPADSWAFNPDVKEYAYDPEQAKELLASVGFEDKDGDGVLEAYGYSGTYYDGTEWSIPDGTPFEISFNTTTGNAMREALSQIFQANMADIGVKVNLDLLPASVYFADDGPLSQRRFDICEYAWVSDPDPGGDTLWVGIDLFNEAGEKVYPEQIPSRRTTGMARTMTAGPTRRLPGSATRPRTGSSRASAFRSMLTSRSSLWRSCPRCRCSSASRSLALPPTSGASRRVRPTM